MPSDFFTAALEKELSMSGITNKELVKTNYSVLLGSNRLDQTGTAISFVFAKEIDFTKEVEEAFTSSILSILDTDDLGLIDSILDKMKLTETTLTKNRNRNGSGMFRLGDSEQVESGPRVGIQMANGKLEGMTKLRGLLKLLTIRYVTEEMRSPSTSGLRYRTGRFATSVDLYPIKVNPFGKETTLSLYYTYMLYPYATFDPRVSTQPWLLKGGARNPQKLIGEALLKAARSLIHSRYKLDIKQGHL